MTTFTRGTPVPDVLAPGEHSPDEDPSDVGSAAASEKRWRTTFDAFRVAEGRDPEAEDRAYLDWLRKHT